MTSTPEVDMGDKPPPKETENRLDVSSAEELIVGIGPLQGAPCPSEKRVLQGISAQKHVGRSFQAEEESMKRDSSMLDELRAQLTPPLHVPAVLAVSSQGGLLPLQAQLDTEDSTKVPPTNFVPLSARLAAYKESLQLERRSRSDGTSPISPVKETPAGARQQPRTGPSSRSNVDPQSRSGVVSTQSQSALLSLFDDLSIQDKASDQAQYSNFDTRSKFSWDLYEHAPGGSNASASAYLLNSSEGPDGHGSATDYNPGVHSHGDGGRQAARAHRLRQASPYPVAALAPRSWSEATTLIAGNVAGGNWTEDDSILGAPHSTSTQKSIRKGKMKTSANKDAMAARKPGLPCLFCRGRKIACTPLTGWSCSQCLRRGLECEYPAESRRGMRKKKKVFGGSPSAANAVTALAGVEMGGASKPGCQRSGTSREDQDPLFTRI
ncbi:hypothetical protein DFH08DRAFT_272790 [Mycena albidolilacea]|uniref:Zn(2)-C6 fungal-type domain-containing protein n=1 Tax=Mycena albidolilacea TaxID=1033008 RepID=A0AAD7F491_9AGAR|nr:hypothetical protein DFH08DRAFT_272790 [Mycena albidolilacea]